MLHIAICDDEPTQLTLLASLVKEWAGPGTEAEICCYQTAARFLFHWEDQKNTDILLLDIEMPGQDGMDLAHALRKKGEQVQILFITGLTDYALEGYEVDAVSYLVKPVKKEQLFRCLDRAVAALNRREPILLVKSAGELTKVPIRRICYLESMGHDTILHLAPVSSSELPASSSEPPVSHLRSRTGLAVLEQELAAQGQTFYAIHRSYLVQLSHIRRITRKDVTMDNGDCLPLARGRWEGLNRAWLQYYRGTEDI